MDIDAIFIRLYVIALKFAQASNQVVGENNDYYITLEQLATLLKDKNRLLK